MVGFTSAANDLATVLQSSELPPLSLSLLHEKEIKTKRLNTVNTDKAYVIALGFVVKVVSR